MKKDIIQSQTSLGNNTKDERNRFVDIYGDRLFYDTKDMKIIFRLEDGMLVVVGEKRYGDVYKYLETLYENCGLDKDIDFKNFVNNSIISAIILFNEYEDIISINEALSTGVLSTVIHMGIYRIISNDIEFISDDLYKDHKHNYYIIMEIIESVFDYIRIVDKNKTFLYSKISHLFDYFKQMIHIKIKYKNINVNEDIISDRIYNYINSLYTILVKISSIYIDRNGF